MKKYEYIHLRFEFSDLRDLNRFSGDGWRVASVVQDFQRLFGYIALLEREIQ